MSDDKIYTQAEVFQFFLDWRNIEVSCTKCQGAGTRAYSSTATWHGGIGGQAITNGVCDHCWGSGDEHKTWTNLRELQWITAKKKT